MRLALARRRVLLTALALALCAAPGVAAEEGAGDIYPGDLGQAVAALLIFAGLLFVLGRYAWKPVIEQIRRREQDISSAIEGAKKRESEAEELLRLYREQLDSADADAEALLQQTRKEAAETREQILQAARQEALQAGASARQEVERAREAALRDLYGTSAELAAEMAERILHKKIDDEEARRLIDEAMADVRQAGLKG